MSDFLSLKYLGRKKIVRQGPTEKEKTPEKKKEKKKEYSFVESTQ